MRKREKKLFTSGLFIGLAVAAAVVFALGAVIVGQQRRIKNLETGVPSDITIEAAADTASPTPESTAQAEPSPSPAPTPEPTPDYSFFWFTDTQYYSAKYPESLMRMTEWMAENAAEYNAKYAFFTGDFVDDSGSGEQWRILSDAVAVLEKELDIFAIAGNHDVGSKVNYDNYLKYYGAKHFEENGNVTAWYKGGIGRCDIVEIGGTRYMFLGVGYGKEASAVSWLNEQLAANPDCSAILFFHDYLTTEGLLSETGKLLYNKVVKKNSNVFMVLCGHRYNCAMLTADIDDDGDKLKDRTVYQIMLNYQYFEEGGRGYLAIISVYRDLGQIRIDTYSPIYDDWYYFDPDMEFAKERLVLPVRIFD